MPRSETLPVPAANLAVVAGCLSRPPTIRSLPGGDLLELDVTVRRPGSAVETVPVVLADPPAALGGLLEGDRVVVVGRVRRGAVAKALAGALEGLGDLS